MTAPRRTVDVVAAVIRKGDKVRAMQRGYGEFKDGWEFPGGKVEPGESPEQALAREIEEEMAASLEVGELLCEVGYDYPAFHLHMRCYVCTLRSGYEMLEHEAQRWLGPDDIGSVAWLPADLQVVEAIRSRLLGR